MTSFYRNYDYHPEHNYPAIRIISTVPSSKELILTLKKLKEDIQDTLRVA